MKRSYLIAALFILCTRSLSAQTSTERPWWVHLGGGIAAFESSLGLTAGMVYCTKLKASVISGRMIGTTNANPTVRQWSPTPATHKLTDYGILYGPMWQQGSWYYSASAGIGLVRATKESLGPPDTRSAVSLPIEGQIFWQFTDFAGAGIYAYASVNAVRPFAGAFVAVQLGSFGPTH